MSQEFVPKKKKKDKEPGEKCPRCGSEDTVLRLDVRTQRWLCNECKAPFRVR